MHLTSSPRWGAISLGVLCAAGAAAVLLEDIFRSGPSIDHALAVVVLVITIGAGHLAVEEARRKRILAPFGLGLLFLIGSIYCIAGTAGRGAETQDAKASAAAAANFKRAELTAELERAKLRKEEAENQAETEMTGQHCLKRCQDWKLRAKEVSAHIEVLTDKIAKLEPELPVNGKIAHAAAVLAALPYVSAPAGEIADRLRLVFPLLPALALELGSLVFFGLGLARQGALTAQAAKEVPAPTVETVVPSPPKPRKRRPATSAAARQQGVADFMAAYRARHGRDPSHAEVMRSMHLPRATASRLRAKALAAG
jgi:hypothetical protein